MTNATPGDLLFLLYSGHGSQQPDVDGLEESGLCDTIIPVDFCENGVISDAELLEVLVSKVPEGVRLTAVVDACHSGTVLDLPTTVGGPFNSSQKHRFFHENCPLLN